MTDYKQEFEKLTELSKPLQEYLLQKYHPHCAIVVTIDDVKVVETQMRIPLSSCER